MEDASSGLTLKEVRAECSMRLVGRKYDTRAELAKRGGCTEYDWLMLSTGPRTVINCKQTARVVGL